MKNIHTIEGVRFEKLAESCKPYFVMPHDWRPRLLFCSDFVSHWFQIPVGLAEKLVLAVHYSTQPFQGARAIKFGLDAWQMPQLDRPLKAGVGQFVFSEVRDIVSKAMGKKEKVRLYVRLDITGF